MLRTCESHTTHTTHATHVAHSTHTAHARHATHEIFVVRGAGALAVLLVLVDPLGEVSLDELRADLLLCEARPVLGLGLLLAEVENEGAGGELVRGGLERVRLAI